MKNRTAIKALLDGAMALTFILLMNADVTGIPLHEILGAAVAALLAVHLILNRKWLANALRRMKSGAPNKQKGIFLLNAAIAVSASTCIVTGVMISQYLFAPLGQNSSAAWYDAHDISAWVSLSLLILHGVLHWRWVAGVIRRAAARAGKVTAIAARAGAGLLAAGAVYSLFAASPIERIALPSQDGAARTPAVTAPAAAPSLSAQSLEPAFTPQPDESDRAVTAAPNAQSDVTLEDYLSKLFCTGCHRRCPLSNPQCSRGERQAEAAAQEYSRSASES